MMKLSTRATFATAALAMTSVVLAGPASADVDEDDVAARLCPAGATWSDDATDDSDDDTSVTVHVYEIDGNGDGETDRLCTFAIISTDEDATLTGSYRLTVGSAVEAGAVRGTDTVTRPIVTAVDEAPSANVTASGQQTTTTVTKASKSTKKAAKAALAKTTKKAKKAYAKAGRTPKAKKAMARKITAATKKYKAAVAPKTKVTKRPYRLAATLPLVAS